MSFPLSNYKNFWKDEEINITFYVSKDITTYFDNSIKNFLNDVEKGKMTFKLDLALRDNEIKN